MPIRKDTPWTSSSCGGSDDALEGFFQLRGMEAVGAGGAFEGNAALRVDDVEAIGPGGVGLLGGVVDGVDQGGDFDFQAADAGLGDGFAFGGGFGIGVNDVLALVDGELPAVARVRFLDVDDVEIGAILVLVIEAVEGGNLPPEGRSCVAAEDEDDGASGVLLERDAAGVAVAGKIERGGGIAGGEAAGAGDGPGGGEGEIAEQHRAGDMRGDGGEAGRREPHDGEEGSRGEQVECGEDQDDSE